MTSDRDFDRLARAWLEFGPDQAPDRVVAAVLRAADVTPQVRRPVRWPRWRSSSMNRLPLAVGAVAVLVVAIGGALLMSQGNQSSVGAPTASPSSSRSGPPTAAPSPIASAAAVPLGSIPPTLVSRWMGPTFDLPGLGSWTRTQIVFESGLVYLAGTNTGNYLTSAVDPTAATLKLTLRDDEAGCHAGDAGVYTWSLGPAGSTLTLKLTTDPCAARAAAFDTTWYRQGCKNDENGCFGDLDAGTHPSQYLTPRRAVGALWLPTWGALTYTVPAGWSNSQDWPNEFTLTPSADYAKETPDGPAAGAYRQIWLFTHPRANKVTLDCGRAVDTTVQPTVDGLLAWLGTDRALTTSPPTEITIDGHPGKWVDIRLASTWKTTCAGGTGKPERAMFAYPSESDSDSWIAGIADKERDRVILLDLDGTTIGILIDSGDPARFDDLVQQAMPIVQSFKFQ